MTRYIKITSKGEIDSKAFELIGASSKTGDKSKIGMFGSGLNYSLAFLLRNKIDFAIFSGVEEIKITTELTNFRDSTFSRIVIDGVKTSFTTDMGKDWEAWFILREIYSNALDEGEENIQETADIEGEADTTSFFIEITPEFQEALDNWEMYFSDKRTDLIFTSKSGVKVYTGGEDMIIYRKGIRVLFEKDRKCAFHYDFPDIAINESRVVTSSFELEWTMENFWLRCDDPSIIRELLKRFKNTYEEALDWSDRGYSMSTAWEKALENRYVVERELEGHYSEMVQSNKPLVLPKVMVDSIISKHGEEKHVAGKDGGKGIKKLEMDEKESYMLNKLEAFCKECEYEVPYPIFVVQFTKKGIAALANVDDKEIYLSKQAFESLSLLIQIVMEETEHINTGFEDNSRTFQTHWIKLFFEEKMKRFAYTV